MYGLSLVPARARAVTLAVALLVGLPISLPAHAAVSGCRSDPKIFLSLGSDASGNGYGHSQGKGRSASPALSAKLEISALLPTDTPGDVRLISYTIHAPTGAAMSRIVYTGGPLKHKEIVRMIADDAPGTFDITSNVSTITAGHSVVIQIHLVSRGSVAQTVRGVDHQNIATRILIPTQNTGGDGPSST